MIRKLMVLLLPLCMAGIAAAADNVAMNIIVCYEELEAFDKAIERLEKMRPTYRDPEFIDLKIKRLKERKANLPGSRGLRK